MTEENFKAVFIRNPLKPKSDDWHETAHKWAITLYGQEFDYYTGVGHREYKGFSSGKYEYDRLRFANLTQDGLKQLLALSRPVPPKADDVIHSLIMDASASEQSFENWCDEFGYSSDSIKALNTYRDCQMNTNKLRRTGLNIEKERERLADY